MVRFGHYQLGLFPINLMIKMLGCCLGISVFFFFFDVLLYYYYVPRYLNISFPVFIH